MKRTLCTIIWILLAFPLFAQAPVVFGWDAHPEAAQLSGFRLYQGTASGVYGATPVATFTPGTAVTGSIAKPPIGRYFYVLTAVSLPTSGSLESDRSNEVAYTVRPQAPTLQQILGQIALGYETIGAGMRELAAYVAEQPAQGAVMGLRVR